MMPWREWPQHAVGMIGQVTAALPQVLVAVYLARVNSLESAGLFTVGTGLTAAAFTIASWGFVPHIVIDRLRQFPPMTYLVARVLALLVMTAATLAAARAFFPEIGLTIVLAVVAFRAADAAVDLYFGLSQVWFGAAKAILVYAGLHASKLLLLVALVSALGAWTPLRPDHVILVSAVLSFLGVAAVLLVQRRLRQGGGHSSARIAQLFGQASWFGLAACLCAVVTNLPRISLPFAYSGDVLGVAGIALTISTFFGMALHTAWIRHFPGLAAGAAGPAMRAYLIEVAVLSTLFLVAAAWPLPQLAAWAFDFDVSRFGVPVTQILMTAVIFFAGMGLANLYKLGHRRWGETLVYLATTVLIVGLAVIPTWRPGLPFMLLVAGAAMAILSLPAVLGRRSLAGAGLADE